MAQIPESTNPPALDYISRKPTDKRLSRLAVASLIFVLLDSPLVVPPLLRELNKVEQSITGMPPSWKRNSRTEKTFLESSFVPLLFCSMAVAIIVPLIAVTRILVSKRLRGIRWAATALVISILGWGLLLIVALNFVAPWSGFQPFAKESKYLLSFDA